MARFRGTVQGGRSEASRLGHTSSGLRVTANGWYFGVKVILRDNGTGDDVADIYLTTGSNPVRMDHCIGTFTLKDLGRVPLDSTLAPPPTEGD